MILQHDPIVIRRRIPEMKAHVLEREVVLVMAEVQGSGSFQRSAECTRLRAHRLPVHTHVDDMHFRGDGVAARVKGAYRSESPALRQQKLTVRRQVLAPGMGPVILQALSRVEDRILKGRRVEADKAPARARPERFAAIVGQRPHRIIGKSAVRPHEMLGAPGLDVEPHQTPLLGPQPEVAGVFRHLSDGGDKKAKQGLLIVRIMSKAVEITRRRIPSMQSDPPACDPDLPSLVFEHL
jgi:hypothetical protein